MSLIPASHHRIAALLAAAQHRPHHRNMIWAALARGGIPPHMVGYVLGTFFKERDRVASGTAFNPMPEGSIPSSRTNEEKDMT